MIKKYILLLLFQGIITMGVSQILFSESFNVILDSTRKIKGSIIPDFKFQTQKENVIEFENLSDLTIKFEKSAVTLANKIEIARNGDESFVSGGYVYGEYRRFVSKRVVPEVYSQIHWAEARGLQLKYALGIYARIKVIYLEQLGIFAGIGPFYEFEKWNYNGVLDALIPTDSSPIKKQNMKLGSYISYKHKLTQKLSLDMSLYHQSRFDELFSTPRLASSSGLNYSLNDELGFILMYQNIYDFKPVVPISNWFHRINATIIISF